MAIKCIQICDGIYHRIVGFTLIILLGLLSVVGLLQIFITITGY